MEVTFSNDIKPLFRTKDVNAMSLFGGFNLHLYEDVKERSTEILEKLEDGSMPCDGAWSEQKIVLFKQWITDGYLP